MTVQRLFVAVGSGQLHYRRAGEGPPVVLLHRLARNFTLVAVDTPGYGLSAPGGQRPRHDGCRSTCPSRV